MPKKIKVLFLAVEVTPLAKVGGLGDVAGALPPALKKLGVDIRICLPLYGSIDRKKYKIKKVRSVQTETGSFNIWSTKLPDTNVPVYLLEHEYFKEKNIYWGKDRQLKYKQTSGFADIMRFALFTELALEAAQAINFRPDIIHANDWHTSLVFNLIEKWNARSRFYKNTKTMYTIHNLANQGIAEPEIVEFCGLNKNRLCIREDLKNSDLNFMVQGILTADLITTVSPTYAKEILTSAHGAGLERLLRRRRHKIHGIVNGIDTEFFNPETDRHLLKRYGLKHIEFKNLNKQALQKELGLPVDSKKALASVVSRLVWQKGLDIIDEKIVKMLNPPSGRAGCQIVVLGSGKAEYEQKLKALEKKYPEKVKVLLKFDEALAHRIYAASDLFLMPSRFEPCGLGQLIAMRYGTVPIVRETGGLKDTVKKIKNQNSKIKNNDATGFVFKKLTSRELLKTTKKALEIFYKHPEIWRRLQENGMKQDWSWTRPAKEYLKLYKKLAN